MTGKYCPGPKSEQEQWLLGFFAGPIDYTLDGPSLQLTTGGKTLQLQKLAEPETLN